MMYRDTVFTIIVYLDVSRYCMHDYCLLLFCGCGCTRASLSSLLSVLVIRKTQSDPSIHDVLLPEIHCRKVFNAERVNWEKRVSWKASRATSGAACFCEVRISCGCRPGGNLAICFQMNFSLWIFSRREVELSVTLFYFLLLCLMCHSQGCSHLSHLHWIKTQGPGL